MISAVHSVPRHCRLLRIAIVDIGCLVFICVQPRHVTCEEAKLLLFLPESVWSQIGGSFHEIQAEEIKSVQQEAPSHCGINVDLATSLKVPRDIVILNWDHLYSLSLIKSFDIFEES